MFKAEPFKTTAYSKWILTGEHAVLRGAPALLFPNKKYALTLQYTYADRPLALAVEGEQAATCRLLFWGLLKEVELHLQKALDCRGNLRLSCDIPIGMGLGFSAALCSALTQWLIHISVLQAEELLTFATHLEHCFHGKSSGADVAVSTHGYPLCYQDGTCSPLDLKWKPHWYLSKVAESAVTTHCVQQVAKLHENNPSLALSVDGQMAESSRMALASLQETDQVKAVTLLTDAIEKAAFCFEQWQLISPLLQQHIVQLKSEGALAVKPTGAGLGGFVLSLWAKPVKLPGLMPILN
jgi:mevalonate kinase